MTMRTLRCAVSALILCTTVASVSFGAVAPAASAAPKSDKATSRAKLEAAWAKKLTGATLVGSFTTDGKKTGKPPRAERYELGAVKKIKGNTWLFTAKIKYGGKDSKVKIPLSLTVRWAGDTPVITMTDFKIPAMGTFTARVLFYGDRYVGTWQHGKVGGHMFGRIEPAKKTDASATPSKK